MDCLCRILILVDIRASPSAENHVVTKMHPGSHKAYIHTGGLRDLQSLETPGVSKIFNLNNLTLGPNKKNQDESKQKEEF